MISILNLANGKFIGRMIGKSLSVSFVLIMIRYRIQDRLPKEVIPDYITIIELETIDKAFKHVNLVLLHGIPGAGKTTLAAEFARWHSNHHKDSVVVWIDADNHKKIDKSVRRILIQDL